ncbi:FHA domain-containing protein [Nocardia sp. NPDC127579]|uniref:FHA domain-containing protein n=1 Tax=Nocardia sp. NPDC127579 TaxID=3345402 RepID=UPI00363FC94C
MVKNPSTVGIAPGEGLIARFGEVVIYLGGETAATERILGAIEAVAVGEHPGAAIVQRLASVIFVSGSEPPPFGLVAPTSDGTVILLRGPLIAEIQGAEGTRRLSGARAFTWVDEIVRDPVRRISISGNIDMPVHPRSDLRDGIVPGGGFELHVGLRRAGRRPARRPAAAPEPAQPAQTMPAGFDALDEPTVPDESSRNRRAGPVTTSPASDGSAGAAASDRPTTEATSDRPATAGTSTRTVTAAETDGPPTAAAPAETDDRPQRPDPARTPETATPRRAPASGGKPAQPRRVTDSEGPTAKSPDGRAEPPATEAMPKAWSQVSEPAVAQQNPIPDSPRPPASAPDSRGPGTGALVYGESTFPLDRPYVIGRSPAADDSVRTAAAAPLQVPRDRHVSRVHAYVTPERGKVFVRDASTPAGTFIAAPGADQWTRIGTAATELPPGWSIRVGERVVTYRPGERRSAMPKILQKRR